MVKEKAVNNKQEATHPPMTRRSRKREYLVEKITKDDHKDLGEANTEDTLVPCLQSLEEERDKNELSSISDGNTDEKNEDSETPKLTTASLKKQLVVCLSDCGDESNLNKIEEPQKVLNECEPLDYSNKSIDVNAGIMPNCSEEQMSAVDSDTKIETNQKFYEVKQISIEPAVEGSAKKRRRMGMCRLSEKERSLFLPKCGNRAEKSEKQNENAVVAKEEKGCSVEVLSPQQQTPEMMQHLKAKSHQNNKNDREETKEETADIWTTMVCESLSTEMHVSEDDPKGGLHAEHIKPQTHEEGLQRTEPGCQMTVVAVSMRESSSNVCKSENTKDSDQSLGNHHCKEKELTRGRIEGKTLDNLCKDHTELDLIQASDQQPVTERQQSKTKTEAHLTVSVCDALSPNVENWETAQKPRLDKQSETEVHLTATLSNIADSVCEPQNPEFQTTKVHSDGSPEADKPAALLNERKLMNEQEEPQKEVEAIFTKILKEHENKYADHNHCEYSNVKINVTEEAPIEQESLHQPDTYDKTSSDNPSQVIGENSNLIHTSVSNTAPEIYCSSMNNNQMMESNCEEKEPHDTDSSTVNVGPSEWREYVSDSQLNTIDMTDQVMNDEGGVSPECYEDVTDLVDGLIRELSSLNRTVMATHRELENLRRRGKNLRNTSR